MQPNRQIWSISPWQIVASGFSGSNFRREVAYLRQRADLAKVLLRAGTYPLVRPEDHTGKDREDTKMRFWLSLLGGIVVLFVVVYLLSAVVGLLFWAGVALVILACIAGVLGYL